MRMNGQAAVVSKAKQDRKRIWNELEQDSLANDSVEMEMFILF